MKITSNAQYYKAQYEREMIFEIAPQGVIDKLDEDEKERLKTLSAAIDEWETEQAKEEFEEPDKFHWHEAIDRTDMMRNILEDSLRSHLVIRQNPFFRALADQVMDKLNELYITLNEYEPVEQLSKGL
jgi:hypothetical protein